MAPVFAATARTRCSMPSRSGVDQVGVGAGLVAAGVVGVPIGVGVPAVVVALVGRVVGEVVGASAGGTVVGRVVGSFVGSRGAGVLVLVSITGVPPDGVVATRGGGRSHM